MSERSSDVLRRLQKDRNFKPQRSSHVLLREGLGSDMPFVLTSQITGEYYNVDFLTAAVWRLIDSEHTVDQLVDIAKKSYSREIENIYSSKLPDQTIRDMVLFFAGRSPRWNRTCNCVETTEVRFSVRIRFHSYCK